MPVVVSEREVDEAREAMGELPAQQRKRLQESPYSLSAYDAGVLTAKGRKMVAYYEQVRPRSAMASRRESYQRSWCMGALNERKQEIDQFPIHAPRSSPTSCKQTAAGNQQDRRDLFKHMLEKDVDTATAMTALGIKTAHFDEAALRTAVLQSDCGQPAGG